MTKTGADLADPAAYLAAALDAAQATAEAATAANGGNWVTDGLMVNAAEVEVCEPSLTEENARHIAANDPAHVLRLVAAHRELLAMHVPGGDKGDDCLGCCEGMNRYEDLIYDWWPCPTIKLLAGAYGWTA
jgi:hypothetical protein